MSLKLNVVCKSNPRNPSEAPKYYASHNAPEVIREIKILEEIAPKTGATPQFCGKILDSFLSVLSEKLGEGHLVKIKNLGSFAISINSIGHEFPEQVTAESIKKIRIQFKPDKLIKKRLKELEFEKPETPYKTHYKTKAAMSIIEK